MSMQYADNMTIHGEGTPWCRQGYSVSKITNHTYYALYDKLNPDAAKKYENKNFIPFSCSSVRCGDFYGRNFDWFYGDEVEFICNVKGDKDRYSSLCVSSGISKLNKDFVSKKKYDYIYEVIPYMAVDGINEFGVTCNINVVPQGLQTTGTNPGKKRIPLMYIVRYILDNFSNAEEAVENIKYDVDCYSPDIRGLGYKIHIMVSDMFHNFILEFIGNECKIIKCGKFDTYVKCDYFVDYPIMTNFYLWQTNIKNGKINASTLTPHSSGYERYNLTLDSYNKLNNMDNMFNHMTNTLKYTKSYTNELGPDFWFSEFVGMKSSDGTHELTIEDAVADDNVERFSSAYKLIKNAFDNRKRDGKTTWQTTHSSVYDIVNKTLTIQTQEGEEIERTTFKLEPYRKPVIYYTSTDKTIITPTNIDFGENVNIVSNTYSQGKGCIEFSNWPVKIGDGAFNKCKKLKTIELPDTINSILDIAFQGCTSLISINIPNSVSYIGQYAFHGTSIKNIYIPKSVTGIHITAFVECASIESIKVSESNDVYDSRNDCNAIISTKYNRLVLGCKNTIIPNNVESIGLDGGYGGPFSGCVDMESINIPNSVNTIGDFAFNRCLSLSNVILPSSINKICFASFYDCEKLDTLTCLSIEPPILDKNVFEGVSESQSITTLNKIYVPSESIDNYKNSPVWSNYSSKIEPIAK